MSAGAPAAEGSASTGFAVTLLSEFLSLGVRDLVLSPGARSQALALAAAEMEKAGRLRLHVRLDERVAGFVAVGLAVESSLPVLVVTTSGTAVANLHPAVLEAHHSGVPLILLTADRPPELRGIGSNQTTHQHGLFGHGIRFVRDVEAPRQDGPESQVGHEGHRGFDPAAVAMLARQAFVAAAGHPGPAGPVQLNLAFREPLSGPVHLPPEAARTPAETAGDASSIAAPSAASSALPDAAAQAPSRIAAAPNTVVVAGHAAGERAEEVARQLGAPLIAEVSSGARFGPHLISAYRELLAEPDFGGQVRRVIVFGHPTLSREVPALIERADVETMVVRGPAAEDYNPGHAVASFVDAVEVTGDPDPDRSWAGRWVQASRMLLEAADDTPVIDAPDAVDGKVTAQFQRQTLAALRAPVSRRSLVMSLWKATWPHDRLVFGASRLIREADAAVPGKKVSVHSNRGLAGIDGTIATATGIALASQAEAHTPGITRVLLGDLTLLHDVGALHFGAGELRPRLQVIVGNDGGGTIFDKLEVAGTAETDAFDRVLYTPHSADFASIAAAFGWRYVFAATRSDLDQALTASDDQVLIEVPLGRE